MSSSVCTSSDHTPTSAGIHRSRFTDLVAAAALIVLPCLVFAQVHSFEFVNYDDGSYVTECPQVLQGLSTQTVRWAFSREANSVTANWHPVTWLSLMTDVTLFGVNSGALHLVNLALHVINGLLVFAVLRSVTNAPVRSGFVAAFFAIHPLHVESVAWVSERKDVLSTFFVLISMAAYFRYVSRRQIRWLATSLVCYTLSLMAKQMFVTLPFLLLLLDYWPLRRLDTSETPEKVSTGRLAGEKLLFFAIAVIFCIIAVVGQTDGHAVGTLAEYPLVKRVANAATVYLLYIRMTVWPAGLAVFYPYPGGSLFAAGAVSTVILAGLTAAAFRFGRQHPFLPVGWCWYLGTLTPVIGIVQIGAQRMADRYMYFPMIGLLIVLVWGACALAERLRIGRRAVAVSGLAAVACLTIAAHIQTGYWKNSLVLFSHAAEVAESSLAYTKLGFEQAQAADFDRAANSFYRALKINPDYVAAHRSLGNMCLAEGDPDAAVGHLQRTIRLDPEDAEAHYNLGIILMRQGQTQAAITHYEEALRITSDNAEVAVNLGIAYLTLDDFSKAVRYFQLALEMKPELPQAQYNLAVAYRSLGQHADALALLKELLLRQPEDPELHRQLALVYGQLGNEQQAAFHEKEAARFQQ